MFTYDKETEMYIYKINDIIFECEEVLDEYEELSLEMSKKYNEKLDDIIEFMMERLTDMYGDISREKVKESLGTPLINLDNFIITYINQTLDFIHIFDIEFGGIFDEFYEFSING